MVMAMDANNNAMLKLVLIFITANAASASFEPTWTSLNQRSPVDFCGTPDCNGLDAHYPSVALCDPRFPKWYNEAKVGFKVHWGPYAVPSYGDKPATVVRNP